jgi:hypothetical protein
MGKQRPSPNENAGKAICLRGHPLSVDNVYLRKDGGRACKACKQQWQVDNRPKYTAWARRMRKGGKLKAGYGPSVVKRTDPDLLRYAIEMIAQTGRRSAAADIIGGLRLPDQPQRLGAAFARRADLFGQQNHSARHSDAWAVGLNQRRQSMRRCGSGTA